MEDNEKKETVYGLMNCMWYAVKKSKDYALTPNDDALSTFFLIKEVALTLDKKFDEILLKKGANDIGALKQDYNAYLNEFMPQFEQLERHFSENRWILGDQICLLDFLLTERFLKIMIFEQELFYDVVQSLANLCSFTNRVLSLEQVELFREEADYMDRPFLDPKISRWS